MNVRHKLPNRRPSQVIKFKHDTNKYFLNAGYYDWEMEEIGEVFLNTAKTGTEKQVLLRDSAILMSLALQYGCPLETMHSALSKLDNGSPEGPVGRAVEVLRLKGDAP